MTNGVDQPETNTTPILSARQALICACVSGWAGDEPSSWSSPATETTIKTWAKSHSPTITDAALSAAFSELLLERLIMLVWHPIFADPVYYCSFETSFLEELPGSICVGGAQYNKPYIGAIWEDFQERHFEEHGVTWFLWGLCAAQGSHGPSDSPWGPCLGCSCVCFMKGDAECNFGLKFANIERTGWPDMRYLHHINANEQSLEDREAKSKSVIAELRRRRPEFPWPK